MLSVRLLKSFQGFETESSLNTAWTYRYLKYLTVCNSTFRLQRESCLMKHFFLQMHQNIHLREHYEIDNNILSNYFLPVHKFFYIA